MSKESGDLRLVSESDEQNGKELERQRQSTKLNEMLVDSQDDSLLTVTIKTEKQFESDTMFPPKDNKVLIQVSTYHDDFIDFSTPPPPFTQFNLIPSPSKSQPEIDLDEQRQKELDNYRKEFDFDAEERQCRKKKSVKIADIEDTMIMCLDILGPS